MPPPLPDRKVIKLRKPVVLYNEDGSEASRVEELVLRTELCSGDLRGMPIRHPLWFDDVLIILSRLSGQPQVVCLKLGYEDFEEVGALIAGFMQRGPAAGKTP